MGVDFRPLRQPGLGPPVMVQRFAARVRRPKYLVRLLAAFFASVVFGIVVAVGAGVLYASDVFQGGTGASAIVAFFAGVVGPIGAVITFLVFVAFTIHWNLTQSARVPSLADRLPAFAAANGFTFSTSDSNPGYPGSIFTRGNARHSINHITSRDGRFFDIGDTRWVPALVAAASEASGGTGQDSTTGYAQWGYIAIDLGRSLPHIVLEPRSENNYVAFGPMLPDRDQMLGLEGDFDKHFSLYCPDGYERDALYIFAPDLMALLVDWAEGLNVEIIDRWLFIYSWRPFANASVADYEHAFRIIELVGAKAARQTKLYSDGQSIRRDVVAPPGRALRKAGSRMWTWVVPPLAVGTVVGTVFGLAAVLLIAFT